MAVDALEISLAVVVTMQVPWVPDINRKDFNYFPHFSAAKW